MSRRAPNRPAGAIGTLAVVAVLATGACSSDGSPLDELADRDEEQELLDQADDDGGQQGGAEQATATTVGEGDRGDDLTPDVADGRGESDVTAADIPDIVEEVEPSVVTVLSDSGLGSGVVYAEDGIIVTNAHVVEGAERLRVGFADGTQVPAELVASTPLLDLAVLRAERDDLPAATFAAELPRVGELAIAMGSPLGLEQTVTAGIVSALGRGIPGSAQSTQALVDLIQTDAAISPGNSGGALVDGAGRVIGINVAYLPPGTGAVSLGFAIPSPTVLHAVEELLETGEVDLAYMGVRPAPLTPQIAARFGLEDEQGALVVQVPADGPADRAGLEPGDLVTSIDGEEVRSVEDFLGFIRRSEPGDEVEVEVLRDGDEMTIEVTLAGRPRE